MKKIFAFLAVALLSLPASALPTCSQYGPDCLEATHGLTSVRLITPLEFPNGDHNYFGFSETEFQSLGLDEYISWNGMTPDSAPAGAPNPMEIKAIKQLDAIVSALPTAPKVYEGTTQRSNPTFIYKTSTVSSGTVAFHLTTDGTSGGTSLCPNGVIKPSLNMIVSDSGATYQLAGAWSNSDKTVTVTAKRTNIIATLLGAQTDAPNGTVVNISAVCY